jgi:hypothetical protein
LLIGDWAPRQLECQLYLAVVISFVPDHVLEQENRVVVMKVHLAACLHPALDRLSHRPCAEVQHFGNAITITLDDPFFLGHVSSELGRVLGEQDQPSIVDVGEQLRDRWAVFDRSDFQTALRQGAEQIDQDRVVPVPGV